VFLFRLETEKASLYVEYYDDIAAVERAFQNEWDDLISNWGRKVATALDTVDLVEDPEGVPPVPEDGVMLALPDGPDRRRYWLCRQANGNWSWFFPTEWWTDLDTGGAIYRNDSPNARVGFLHRPESDREVILGNHELTFYLRNAPSGNEQFYPQFADRFNADEAVGDALPEQSERRGVKSNVIEATYEISVEDQDSLFSAYIAALCTAIDDHIVSNHPLIERIDDIYQETLDEVMDTDGN